MTRPQLRIHYHDRHRWRDEKARWKMDKARWKEKVTDGVQTARAITFSELRDGRIVRQTEYWPDPFEAAEWRAQWVERLLRKEQ